MRIKEAISKDSKENNYKCIFISGLKGLKIGFKGPVHPLQVLDSLLTQKEVQDIILNLSHLTFKCMANWLGVKLDK